MIFSNPKKKHYKDSLLNFKKSIWNLEFDIASMRSIREGIRQQYDKLKEEADAFGVRITNLEKRNAPDDKQEIELVKQRIERINQDLGQLQEQMQGIDNEIEGVTYTDEKNQQRHHDGILEKIDKYNTRCEMLKEYISKL